MKRIVCVLALMFGFFCVVHLVNIMPYYRNSVLVIYASLVCMGMTLFLGMEWMKPSFSSDWHLRSRIMPFIFFLPLEALVIIALSVSFYTVDPNSVVSFKGKLLYPGEKLFLLPVDSWNKGQHILNDHQYVWTTIKVPESSMSVFVSARVSYDFKEAKVNGPAFVEDIPNVESELIKVFSSHAVSDWNGVVTELFKMHLISGKIPTYWSADEIKIMP